MSPITEFLNDILDAKQKGRSTWSNWLKMLTDAHWKKRFGPDWKNKDKAFWRATPIMIDRNGNRDSRTNE